MNQTVNRQPLALLSMGQNVVDKPRHPKVS